MGLQWNWMDLDHIKKKECLIVIIPIEYWRIIKAIAELTFIGV